MARNTSIREGDKPEKPGLPDEPTDTPTNPQGGGGKADPDKGHPEFQQFWDNLMTSGAPFQPGVPFRQLKAIALAAWKQGKSKQEIRKLFGNKAASLFASNAAGGEGNPSPYLDYFTENLDQAGALIDYLNSGAGVIGPSQQQEFFGAFEGLQESYLGSLGLELVTREDGSTYVRDPEFPHLTPYLAEQKRREQAGLSSVFDSNGSGWVQGTPGGAYWNTTGAEIPPAREVPRMFHNAFMGAMGAGDSQAIGSIVDAARSYADMSQALASFQPQAPGVSPLTGYAPDEMPEEL